MKINLKIRKKISQDDRYIFYLHLIEKYEGLPPNHMSSMRKHFYPEKKNALSFQGE